LSLEFPSPGEGELGSRSPPLKSPADAPGVIAALLGRVSAGEIAPSEAQAIANLLEAYRRQSELADIEARLRALEDQANAKR
jgi:hypothetical protein